MDAHKDPRRTGICRERNKCQIVADHRRRARNPRLRNGTEHGTSPPSNRSPAKRADPYSDEKTIEELRANHKAGGAAIPLPDGTTFETVDASGVPSEWIQVPGVDTTASSCSYMAAVIIAVRRRQHVRRLPVFRKQVECAACLLITGSHRKTPFQPQ